MKNSTSTHIVTHRRYRPRPIWLRRFAVLQSVAFLASSVLALPIRALAHETDLTVTPVKSHDDPTWHTIDYHAQSKRRPVNSTPPPSSVTLLDDVGHLARPVTNQEVANWKREINANHIPSTQKAKLSLWLGEYALGHDEQPEQALAYFRNARLSRPQSDPLYGIASYDSAIASFYEGAYQEAQDAFHHLLFAKPSLHGFDRRNATLFLRHAMACAGYHEERSLAGIPEPPRLDPLCGAAALAACLRTQHQPADKATLLANMHVTGRGSNVQNVIDAAKKLGMAAHLISTDDTGLIKLPKPLVAYVEHDHFVALVRANKQGISYLCSDCGPWPGGQVNLTWKQWHKLEATSYISVVPKDSLWDSVLSHLATDKTSTSLAAKRIATSPLLQVASARPSPHLFDLATQAQLISVLAGHVLLLGGTGGGCGNPPWSLPCFPFICCPTDGPGSMSGFSAGAGEPVNLATGEEEYRPAPDLTIYNPIGPSVSWSRIYNSLRVTTPNYLTYDYGHDWSQNYNIGLDFQNSSSKMLFPNGAQISFSFASSPSASNPVVVATLGSGAGGYPFQLTNNYSASGNFYAITLPDRSQWIMKSSVYAYIAYQHVYFPPAQIKDRSGNAINFNYSTIPVGNPYTNLVLSSISDKNNSALLTVNRDAGTHNITSISDRYNRSVYYRVSTYMSAYPSYAYQELDHVSQIVQTGTASPPDRYVYGYQNVANGEIYNGGAQAIPFLHTLTAPSPTGTGTATVTINYTPTTCAVSSVVDANGNTRAYTAVDASHTKVTITDKNNNVAYSYIAGFDMNMSGTTRTDGAGTIIQSEVFADPNNPYRPSQAQDGNGYAVSGAGGKGTWTYAWDRFGNCTSATTPRSVTTSFTYSYTNFALGELTQQQQGSKQAISYTYFEPSGLLHTVTSPKPGTVGGTQSVTTTYSWSTLGNLLSVNTPGNNATIVNNVDQGITTSYNYTQDGTYNQSEALGQPIKITDNLGKISHCRYNSEGWLTSATDPSNVVYTYSYNRLPA